MRYDLFLLKILLFNFKLKNNYEYCTTDDNHQFRLSASTEKDFSTFLNSLMNHAAIGYFLLIRTGIGNKITH